MGEVSFSVATRQPMKILRLCVALAIVELSAATSGSAQETVAAPYPDSLRMVRDTLAHPVVLGCGDRLDPVGYVIRMAEELQLTPTQSADLANLNEQVVARNIPLAAKWRWTDRKSVV